MAHLTDASCLIQAKNSYYGFDICPGFWDWIDQQNTLGVLFSIDKIRSELMAGNDDLAAWTKQKDHRFFLPVDATTLQSYSNVVAWINSSTFTPFAISEFLRGADPFLIAHALAHGHTVVSHEIQLNPNQRRQIKIPAVCAQFSVPHVNIFDLLRSTGARLHL